MGQTSIKEIREVPLPLLIPCVFSVLDTSLDYVEKNEEGTDNSVMAFVGRARWIKGHLKKIFNGEMLVSEMGEEVAKILPEPLAKEWREIMHATSGSWDHRAPDEAICTEAIWASSLLLMFLHVLDKIPPYLTTSSP